MERKIPYKGTYPSILSIYLQGLASSSCLCNWLACILKCDSVKWRFCKLGKNYGSQVKSEKQDTTLGKLLFHGLASLEIAVIIPVFLSQIVYF